MMDTLSSCRKCRAGHAALGRITQKRKWKRRRRRRKKILMKKSRKNKFWVTMKGRVR